MNEISFADSIIGHNQPCYIIAEAGVNHNGSLEIGCKLIDVAADAGADAVKFQTFKTEEIILSKAPKAAYHIETTGDDSQQSWFDLLKSQELDKSMHQKLIEHCNSRGIQFLSTPYDLSSIDLLVDLEIPIFKVASTDANNLPLLQYMASKGKPIILSTAMCDLREVKKSVSIIRDAGINDIVVLQCTGSYPAPFQQANLSAMKEIAQECNVAVGYSDHVPGFNAAISAVAMGACVYEKHFTLDRNLPGPDHRSSLEPKELKELIHILRETEAMLGDGVKKVMPCEANNRSILRKFIVAKKMINIGEEFSIENLTTKRSGGQGLEPGMWNKIIGLKSVQMFDKDQPITESDVKDCK